MKSILVFISLLLLASVGYAHDFDNGSVREGYLEGYHHGSEDHRSGVNFNYGHAPEYQSGNADNSLDNCEYRIAYIEGYVDGYFTHASRYDQSQLPPSTPSQYGEYGRPQGQVGGSVTVYDEPGFRGSSSSFEIGRYAKLPEGWNDDIESIRLSGPVRVILFDEKDFGGEKMVVERDSDDLRDFENKSASMIVEPMSGGFATVFKKTGYQGDVRELEIGRYPSLKDGWDDEIESVQISGNIRVILFDKKDFEGRRMVVDRDAFDLGDFRKKAASVIVEPAKR
jgi:hypothetical protein